MIHIQFIIHSIYATKQINQMQYDNSTIIMQTLNARINQELRILNTPAPNKS